MKIEIRPIEQKRWHGKQGAENFTRPKKISALIDPSTREYATGLTPKEAEEYGAKLKKDLSPTFNPEVPHPFWDSTEATLKLENSTMFLDLNLILNKIKYAFAKKSKYIANSLREYEEGLYPDATHVIYDEKEEAVVKATKIELRNQAITETAKLTKDRKVEIILILAGKNLKEQSDSFITVAMNDLIEKQPSEVVRYIQMKDKGLVTLTALVLECLQKSVLVKKGHNIMYHDSILGTDEAEVAKYLSDDMNQDLKLRLMGAITN